MYKVTVKQSNCNKFKEDRVSCKSSFFNLTVNHTVSHQVVKSSDQFLNAAPQKLQLFADKEARYAFCHGCGTKEKY